jgi:hypothetical protein
MRNYTNLTTKDIRLAMKRYIILYDGLKQFGLDFSCKTNYGIFIVITII